MSINQVNVQLRRGFTPSDLGFACPVEEGVWEDSDPRGSDLVDWDSLEQDVPDWASLDRDPPPPDVDPPPPFGDSPPPHGDLPPPQIPHFVGKANGQVAADPLDRAVAGLRQADQAMAVVLRAIADAGPRDGLSVRRHVALAANATGIDVGFIDRAVQTLSAMPKVWAAFDMGGLSWSQLRGIIIEARRLTVAQRQVLDDALSVLLVSGGGEPDRIVETAGDLAARLDREGEADNEDAQERSQGVVLQPDFTRRRWRMTMDLDGTLHTTIRRKTYTTRPPLTPPPALRPAGTDPPGADPPGADPPGCDQRGCDPPGYPGRDGTDGKPLRDRLSAQQVVLPL